MIRSCYHLRHVMSRPVLVLIVVALRLAAGVGLSWNWAKILGNASIMATPRKDLELFAPGAATFLRTVAEQEQAISRLATRDLPFVIGLAIIGCAVTAFAFDILSERQDLSISLRIRKSLHAVPKMLGISVVCWLILVAVFLFAKLLYLLIPLVIYPIAGERGADVAILLLAIVVLVASFVVFIASDLARAIAVVSNRGTLNAVAHSIVCLRQAWGKCLVGATCWTLPALAGPPIVEYFLSSTGPQGTYKTMTLILAHQLMVLTLCVLHLCWWSKAIELICSAPSRPRILTGW
jgi:hypothetical protein